MAKILAVDDDPEILFVLRATFESVGHEVLTTDAPREVAALVDRWRPDAVTLDVMMPEVSGWQVLDELRGAAATKDLPILMLTALDDVPDRVRGLREGADDYLAKPFAPDELIARLERLIVRTRRAPSMAEAPPLVRELAGVEMALHRGENVRGLALGRYTLEKFLGDGAMGRVFQAWDDKLKRRIALKTIRCDNGSENAPAQVSRLLIEAEACAACSHPNIVTIFDVHDEGPAGFIAMELVDGGTLRDQICGGRRLAPDLVLPLATGIAAGLARAHSRGLLHRDIKPANVLLGMDDAIKLTDFGISAWTSKPPSSQPRAYGTPGYIAPETLCGEGCDEMSDLFSLGVMLYECLTGRHPFVGEEGRDKPAHVVHNTLVTRQIAACEVCADVPPAVSEMLDRLLEKEPTKRPQSAAVVARFFERRAHARKARWRWQPPFISPPPLEVPPLQVPPPEGPPLEGPVLKTANSVPAKA